MRNILPNRLKGGCKKLATSLLLFSIIHFSLLSHPITSNTHPSNTHPSNTHPFIIGGQNNRGQLGLGHSLDKTTPQLIDSFSSKNKYIKMIAAGELHSVAVTNKNRCICHSLSFSSQSLKLNHSITQSLTQSLNHSNSITQIQSLNQSLNHSLAISLTYSLMSKIKYVIIAAGELHSVWL